MSRFFHSSAYLRKILNWTVKGTTAEVGWVQENVQATVNQHPVLSTKAAQATIEYANHLYFRIAITNRKLRGDPHPTTKKDGTVDPYHASGIIFSESGNRLTSYHAYKNGVVRFSKNKYNVDNPESSGSSQAFKTA